MGDENPVVGTSTDAHAPSSGSATTSGSSSALHPAQPALQGPPLGDSVPISPSSAPAERTALIAFRTLYQDSGLHSNPSYPFPLSTPIPALKRSIIRCEHGIDALDPHTRLLRDAHPGELTEEQVDEQAERLRIIFAGGLAKDTEVLGDILGFDASEWKTYTFHVVWRQPPSRANSAQRVPTAPREASRAAPSSAPTPTPTVAPAAASSTSATQPGRAFTPTPTPAHAPPPALPAPTTTAPWWTFHRRQPIPSSSTAPGMGSGPNPNSQWVSAPWLGVSPQQPPSGPYAYLSQQLPVLLDCAHLLLFEARHHLCHVVGTPPIVWENTVPPPSMSQEDARSWVRWNLAATRSPVQMEAPDIGGVFAEMPTVRDAEEVDAVLRCLRARWKEMAGEFDETMDTELLVEVDGAPFHLRLPPLASLSLETVAHLERYLHIASLLSELTPYIESIANPADRSPAALPPGQLSQHPFGPVAFNPYPTRPFDPLRASPFYQRAAHGPTPYPAGGAPVPAHTGVPAPGAPGPGHGAGDLHARPGPRRGAPHMMALMAAPAAVYRRALWPFMQATGTIWMLTTRMTWSDRRFWLVAAAAYTWWLADFFKGWTEWEAAQRRERARVRMERERERQAQEEERRRAAGNEGEGAGAAGIGEVGVVTEGGGGAAEGAAAPAPAVPNLNADAPARAIPARIAVDAPMHAAAAAAAALDAAPGAAPPAAPAARPPAAPLAGPAPPTPGAGADAAANAIPTLPTWLQHHRDNPLVVLATHHLATDERQLQLPPAPPGLGPSLVRRRARPASASRNQDQGQDRTRPQPRASRVWTRAVLPVLLWVVTLVPMLEGIRMREIRRRERRMRAVGREMEDERDRARRAVAGEGAGEGDVGGDVEREQEQTGAGLGDGSDGSAAAEPILPPGLNADARRYYARVLARGEGIDWEEEREAQRAMGVGVGVGEEEQGGGAGFAGLF